MKIALLIDGENIAAQHFPAILSNVGELGEPVVRRLFGISKDWEAVARQQALKVEWQASGGKGKNTVDIAMAVHAMDIVHRGIADAICLVSSDCDFQPLAIHLREAGTTVYGMGEEKTDPSLRQAYTQFHVLETPSEQTLAARPREPTKVKTPKLAVVNSDTDVIVKQMPASFGWIGLQELGTKLRRADPAISARLKGKGRLARYLDALPCFQKEGSGASIRYRLRPAAAQPARSSGP